MSMQPLDKGTEKQSTASGIGKPLEKGTFEKGNLWKKEPLEEGNFGKDTFERFGSFEG